MTITLSDGRANLYQWDTGRTVVLDFDAAQCHFENKAYGRTVDVEIKDKTAIIPDVLLQKSGKLRVFAFVGTADEGYTKIEKIFDIIARNKPADYVFTPSEQITLETAVTTANDAKKTAEEAKETADSVRADADAGKFDGAQGAQGEPGKDGADGKSFTWKGIFSLRSLVGGVVPLTFAVNDVIRVINDMPDTLPYESGCWVCRQATDELTGEELISGWLLYFGLLATDGTDGANGKNGKDGKDGVGFTWRGEYSESTAYALNDVVLHNGSCYVSLHDDNRNITPDTSDSYWSLMASKGEDGSKWYVQSTEPSVTREGDFWMDANGTVSRSYYTEDRGYEFSYTGINLKGKDGTNGKNGAAGKDGVSFIWRGAWSATPETAYAANDVVEHNGSAWICMSKNTPEEPSELASDWNLIVKKGSDGATGATGATGAKGEKGDKGDTGAAGVDGQTPHIGDNGNWFIGDVDTGMPSRGEDGTNGSTAYQIALEHGYTGTETQWIASLRAANPVVLPLSQYATEAEAIAYMDSQTDHSVVYVWNNKLYCYASKSATQITGACLYGYRNSASSGVVTAAGKSMYVIPVSAFTAPLHVEDYQYPISSTPHIYGGTAIPTFNKALIQDDSWVGKSDAFDISVAQLQGCTYVVFAVTTDSQPTDVSVTINGTVIPLTVITSPTQIESTVGMSTTTVNGYIDSGVVYTAIVSSDSTQKYISARGTYVMPVPPGYCESHATFEAGTHYLTKYPYATMDEMFSALATANSDYITETVLGKDQSNTYDIKSYILDAPSSLASGQTSAVSSEKPVFIITSGLHGVEPDAVHTVYHFIQDLAENFCESEQLQYLHDNIKFVIIPICNPWGYVNQNYHNSRDVDINKNFESGYRTNGTDNTGTAANSEAETQLMKQVFDAYSKAIFHLECHGKYGVDTAFSQTIWFSLMKTLASELIELNANKLNSQIGKRLYKLGYSTNKSTGGYITYYALNGRPKDYTGTKYGILSATMEGTGCIYGETGYSANTQKINCEALENFVLNIIAALNSGIKVRSDSSV